MSFHTTKHGETGLTPATKALLLDLQEGKTHHFNDAAYGDITPRKKDDPRCTKIIQLNNEKNNWLASDYDRLVQQTKTPLQASMQAAWEQQRPKVLTFKRLKASDNGSKAYPSALTIQTVTPLHLLSVLSAQNPRAPNQPQ